jgi:putative glycosyltransferase
MKLSVVTSLYCSEDYIEEFYERALKSVMPITDDYEFVFVNDGSPDNSLERALALIEKDSNVRVVDFSRNFGHHKALLAGIAEAKGDYVFLIDVDLEEPPELLSEFWEKLNTEPDADVVYGVQKSRKGGLFERVSGRMFYKAMGWLSEFEYPADAFTARLMSRRYVDALQKFDDREYDLWINFALTGFNQIALPADKGDKGSSQYTFSRKLKHAIESITASSAIPLYMIFVLGWIIFGIACSYFAFLVVNKIFFDVPPGWSALAASIWGLGGIIMISVGIVGIYLAKIFVETKKRPDSIIRKIYSTKESD